MKNQKHKKKNTLFNSKLIHKIITIIKDILDIIAAFKFIIEFFR